jgi:hypothetical protein
MSRDAEKILDSIRREVHKKEGSSHSESVTDKGAVDGDDDMDDELERLESVTAAIRESLEGNKDAFLDNLGSPLKAPAVIDESVDGEMPPDAASPLVSEDDNRQNTESVPKEALSPESGTTEADDSKKEKEENRDKPMTPQNVPLFVETKAAEIDELRKESEENGDEEAMATPSTAPVSPAESERIETEKLKKERSLPAELRQRKKHVSGDNKETPLGAKKDNAPSEKESPDDEKKDDAEDEWNIEKMLLIGTVVWASVIILCIHGKHCLMDENGIIRLSLPFFHRE